MLSSLSLSLSLSSPCSPSLLSLLPFSLLLSQVIPILLPLLDGISSLRIYVPKDLRPLDNRMSVSKSVNEVHKRFDKEGGIPLLDPVEDLQIDDEKFKKAVRVCF